MSPDACSLRSGFSSELRVRIGLMTILRSCTAALAPLALCLAAFGQEARLTPRESAAHPTLATGSPAPDFDLPGIDGKNHKLAEYNDPILVVMFLCNHCP